MKLYHKTLLPLIIFLTVALPLQAQRARLDKLLKANADYRFSDARKVDLLNELSWVYCSMQADSALKVAEEAIALAEKLDMKKSIGVALYNKALAVQSSGNISEAIKLFNQAIIYNTEMNNKQILGNCYLFRANSQYSIIDTDSLIRNYRMAIKYFEEINDSTGIFLASLGIANAYFYNDNALARKYLMIALEGFSRYKDVDNYTFSLVYFGSLYMSYSDYDSAKYIFNKAIRLAHQTGNIFNLTNAYGALAMAHGYQGNYSESIRNYLMALRYSEQMGQKMLQAFNLNNLAWIYRELDDNDKSLEYLNKQLPLSVALNDRYSISGAYQEYALVYIAQKKYDAALDQGRKMYRISREMTRADKVTEALGILGQAFEGLQQFDSAVYYYNEAVIYCKKIESPYYLAENLTGLARTIVNIPDNKIPEALRSVSNLGDKTDKAIAYAEEAHSLSKDNNENKLQRNAAQLLSLLYESQDNTQMAFKYHKIFSILNDSLMSHEKTKAIAGMQFQYENEKKDQEIALLKAQKEVNQLKASNRLGMNFALGIALSGLIVIAFTFYNQNKKTKNINGQLEIAFADLRDTQSQLVRSEKMAAFGIMASRVAHEIQNPLNFVNNFSDLSQEMIVDLLNDPNLENRKITAKTITDNLERINYHGKRAEFIVKQLFEHSRAGTAHEFFEESN